MNKEKEVITLIKKALKTKSKITLKSTSDNIKEWDSLGHLNILLALEKNISNKVSNINELSSAHSIKKIVDLLKKNKLIS